MRKTLVVLAALACSASLPAAAQKPDVTGGTAVASEPGKAAMARAIKVTAQVMAIDKGTRTLTLKGPDGKTVDVVAPEEVKNFPQIKVGDFVVVQVVQSLALELKKTKGGEAVGMTEGMATAKPGERPAAVGAREITAIAKVTAVDPKAKTISLRGPRGNVVKLDVQNPDQFKVVKVGDEVLVTYTEAAAVSVEPGKKSAAAKKK
jgi:predicted RecA/RadA family phage recombinase